MSLGGTIAARKDCNQDKSMSFVDYMRSRQTASDEYMEHEHQDISSYPWLDYHFPIAVHAPLRADTSIRL
jgi:hypothetical protein